MEPTMVILAVLVVLIVVAVVIARWQQGRHTPDDPTNRAVDEPRSGPTEPYPGTDRPAGPGAESTAAPEPGDPAPGHRADGDTPPPPDGARPNR